MWFMTNEKQTIFQFLTSTQTQAILTGAGILVVLLNLYIASRLSPLVVSINTLETRANNTETSLINFVPKSELLLMLDPITQDLGEIRQDVKDIKNAIGKL